MHKNYQDKWKKFLMRALRNIDFLNNKVDDDTIEEITYKVRLDNYNADNYIFKQSQRWKEIFIVVNGEIDIFINNNKIYDIHMDTLYSGCTIGSYTCLTEDDYSISAKAKTDWTVIVIDKTQLESLRKEYEDINTSITEYEEYIRENGLPFLDYKMHRSKSNKMKPHIKLQKGLKRIVRIVRSYKIDDFQGLLMAHRDQLVEEKNKKAASRRPTANAEQRSGIIQQAEDGNMNNIKINTILEMVWQQSNKIEALQKSLKRIQLQSLTEEDRKKYLEKIKHRSTNSVSSSSSSSSSEGSGK